MVYLHSIIHHLELLRGRESRILELCEILITMPGYEHHRAKTLELIENIINIGKQCVDERNHVIRFLREIEAHLAANFLSNEWATELNRWEGYKSYMPFPSGSDRPYDYSRMAYGRQSQIVKFLKSLEKILKELLKLLDEHFPHI